VVVQVGAVKILWQQWRRSGKRKEGMKLSLSPKLVEKLVWVPVFPFCKLAFDALAETRCSWPLIACLYG